MLSGIGPAEHLRDRDIDAVVDLPVGDNLQDHLLVGVVQTATRPIDPLHAHMTESCSFSRSSPDAVSCDIEISFNKEMHFAPPVDDGVPGSRSFQGSPVCEVAARCAFPSPAQRTDWRSITATSPSRTT